MSRLQELINQYCPNRVEFRKLGDIAEIEKGVQFNKRDMKNVGPYPVINGGINPSGYIEQYNQEGNTITISQGGASAGYVNWITDRFWAGAHCYVIFPSDVINNRFLYHTLKSREKYLQSSQYGAGIPSLAKSTIDNLTIPVPPLPVQQEIVSILDKFTELISGLKTELILRKKQYEYYRDKLLTFQERR